MRTHRGYTTQSGKGAKCSDCDEWIKPGEKAVKMSPAEIGETGRADPEATAIHGVVHLSCFKEL